MLSLLLLWQGGISFKIPNHTKHTFKNLRYTKTHTHSPPFLAAEAAERLTSFATRVATAGLEQLSTDDVYELLHRLAIPVAKSVLLAQDIDGSAMIDGFL